MNDAPAPYQGAFAMVAPLRDPAAATAVKQLLEPAGRDVRLQGLLPLDKLTTVHYLRILVVEGEPAGNGDQIGPSLALATDFDPPLLDHLDELVRVGGEGLCTVLAHCAGFPAPDQRTPERIREYLLTYSVPSQARYIGTPYRTAQRVKQEAALRRAVNAFIDAEQQRGAWKGKSRREVRAAIIEHVRADPQLAWVFDEPPARPATRLALVTRILGLGVGALLFLWFLVPAYLVLRFVFERRDAKHDDPDGSLARDQARQRMDNMVAREDFQVQNQLTHLVAIKPGPLRQLALRLVLVVVDLMGRGYYLHGHLGGIPSIHFARWMIIDGGRRLIFFSNYDGSWESYLGDFVDRASSPLSAIWSNTVGFPKARFLVREGSRDEDRFKTWARSRQIKTQLWYSAYPLLSVQNVNANSALRAGMIGELDDKQLAEWGTHL
jgi:hypothetical protein